MTSVSNALDRSADLSDTFTATMTRPTFMVGFLAICVVVESVNVVFRWRMRSHMCLVARRTSRNSAHFSYLVGSISSRLKSPGCKLCSAVADVYPSSVSSKSTYIHCCAPLIFCLTLLFCFSVGLESNFWRRDILFTRSIRPYLEKCLISIAVPLVLLCFI